MKVAEKVYVTKCFRFEASHHLINYKGKCSNLHGHSYKLEVTASGNILSFEDEPLFSPEKCVATDGMVLDFSKIKSLVNEVIIDRYDHSNLNNYFKNPTAEVMAVEIYSILNECFLSGYCGRGINLESVKLWETEDSYAEYKGGR